MLKLDTVAEMRGVLPDVFCDEMLELCSEFGASANDPEQMSLSALFESPVYVIEAVEELADVRSHDGGLHGRLSLLEGPSRWFDIAEWIGNGRFARFVAIDTASGGIQYLIPAAVARDCSNVAASIALIADCST